MPPTPGERGGTLMRIPLVEGGAVGVPLGEGVEYDSGKGGVEHTGSAVAAIAGVVDSLAMDTS